MIEIFTDADTNTFYLKFPFSQHTIELVKSINGRKWNPEIRMWSVPASPAAASTIDRTLRSSQYTGDELFNKLLAEHNKGLDMMSAEPTFRQTATPCWKHQLQGLDLTIERKVCYLAWEMGTGKSKTVVDTAGILRLQRTLILCPKSVVGAWPRQFVTHGFAYGIRCVPLNKKTVAYRTKVARKALSMGPAALVINYEAAWHKPFYDWALAQCWDLVVCDEAHRIKDSKARVSKFVHKLVERSERRICLSGTPIPNNPLDLWSQCKFLDSGLLGTSFVAFRSQYAVMGGFQDKQVLAFRNLDQLNKRFYEVAHRVTKEEALDLPPQIDETREIEMNADAVRHYSTMEGQFYAQVDEGSITLANVLVESLRLQQLTGGHVQYDEKAGVERIDDAKGSALGDIIADLPSTEPVVVFCKFTPDLDMVHEIAERHGRESRELSGRRDEWEQFQYTDTGGEVIAVQIQAGGLGIDLTRSAYAVYYSLGFSLGDYDQSRSRLHRPGQNRSVTYYHLLSRCRDRNTVDHKVYRALSKKGDIAEEILSKD